MKFYLFLIVFSIFPNSFGQSLSDNFENGKYEFVIGKASAIKTQKSLQQLTLLANSYSRLNKQSEFLSTINEIGKLKTNKSKLVYHSQLSVYYQQMLFIDSCLYQADLSLKLLKNFNCTDSAIISDVYKQYGNAMRNGGAYHEAVNKAATDFESMQKRCDFLLNYFKIALKYSKSNNQKADILRNIGTMYSDASAAFPNRGKKYKLFADESINYLNRSINIENSPADKAVGYALIGLNQFYIGEHLKANKTFQIALELTRNDDNVVYTAQFFAITDWYGMNCEKLFDLTKQKHYLILANSIYKENIAVWWSQIQQRNFNDAYNNSCINRLVQNHLHLYQLSKDSTHLFQAFLYAEQSKYPDLFNKKISVKSIQKTLDNNTAYVSYNSISRPSRNVTFIITKNDLQITVCKNNEVQLDAEKSNFLYAFKNIHSFKKWSYLFYESYFQSTDSILKSKKIQNVIISNSDQMSMLNLDVLISDTKGNKWQELKYLFHDYHFSYALCAGSYFEHEKPSVNQPLKLGVSLGEFTNEPNLRFSQKLTDNLIEQYSFKKMPLFENITTQNISLLLSHGIGSYSSSNASVMLSSEKAISSKDIEHLQLSNELVIFSACNTNASQQYYGQGAIGNFNQAFRRAGSKSVVTTSWSIDDKANSFIIEKFLNHLSEGMNKSEALWQAKKDYWNQCEEDEEFKPLYWAPYILTGNIESINIQKGNKQFNYYWLLLLLLVPIGVLFKRRFF